MLKANRIQAIGNSDRSGEPDDPSTDMATQTFDRDVEAVISRLLAREGYYSGKPWSLDSSLMRTMTDTAGNTQSANGAPTPTLLSQWQFPVRSSTLHALQEWEGHVLELHDKEFEARLIDVTGDASHEGEEATIPLEELSDHDVERIRVGSIFRWVIGYERSPAGIKKRVSHVVLRDLPGITVDDRRDSEIWAHKASQLLGP